MKETLSWGIIGAGRIAGSFAKGLQQSQTGQLVAVGSRDQAKAQTFCDEFGPDATAHGSYDALLGDPKVEAVYIATPHPQHSEWAIKAAEAGKHILCEKPITLNRAEAEAVIEAALRHHVFLMEAWMYRCHPQTKKLLEVIASGAIGEIRVIQATFSFNAGYHPEGRLFSDALGGGGILDVGGYTTSYARLLAGAKSGKPFLDPVEVHAIGEFTPTGTDAYSAAVLRFDNGVLAQCSCGVQVRQENCLRIYGSDGMIHLPEPYVIAREGGPWSFTVTSGKETRTEQGHEELGVYAFEADEVAEHVGTRLEALAPAAGWEDTIGNMDTLDRWRQSLNFEYEVEKPDGGWPTLTRRPLQRRAEVAMPYGQVAHLEKPVSRLVMGVDNEYRLAPCSVLWDTFFEDGGNCFDTAWLYKGGTPERALGRWVENRGVRNDVCLIVKGAHTPRCYPDDLTEQLHESLERLRTDHADLYFMHRDNPEVPVSEFVDVLNEHVQAGRIRAFGGSNWTPARIDEANRYAQSTGKQAFTLVSNNFSLARMVDPVWAGCVASSEPENRAWHERSQIPVFAWSSQARGFFTERAGPWEATAPRSLEDAQLVRCWVSEDNLQRRARALALAEHFGVLPINIALAYVLHQPFPTFSLIGPRRLSELRSTLPALGVSLTAEMLTWLNLETDAQPF